LKNLEEKFFSLFKPGSPGWLKACALDLSGAANGRRRQALRRHHWATGRIMAEPAGQGAAVTASCAGHRLPAALGKLWGLV